MITFSYNNIDMSILTVQEVTGRGTLGSDLETVDIAGADGVHYLGRRILPRTITIRAYMTFGSLEERREKVDEINYILSSPTTPVPLKFSDEPEMTYYAILDGDVDWEEDIKYFFATWTFTCPDPFKYGGNNAVTLSTNTSVAFTPSSYRDMAPIITLTATKPSSLAMVARTAAGMKDEYMMVGQPAEVDAEIVPPYTNILSKTGTTLVGWTTSAASETHDGIVTGTMTVDNGKFVVSDYGEGPRWHGPAIKTSLSEPLTDFKLEAVVTMNSSASNAQTGFVDVSVIDESGKLLIGNYVGDLDVNMKNGITRYRMKGNRSVSKILHTGTNYPTQYSNFRGVLRIQRIGNVWSMYTAKFDAEERHTNVTTYTWTDTTGEVSGRVAQVTIQMAEFGTNPNTTVSLESIRVDRINQVGTNQVPLIVNTGDTIVFNHETRTITRNGEDIRSAKDFGATFFRLKPGVPNYLTIIPENTFTGYVTWRSKYY